MPAAAFADAASAAFRRMRPMPRGAFLTFRTRALISSGQAQRSMQKAKAPAFVCRAPAA